MTSLLGCVNDRGKAPIFVNVRNVLYRKATSIYHGQDATCEQSLPRSTKLFSHVLHKANDRHRGPGAGCDSRLVSSIM